MTSVDGSSAKIRLTLLAREPKKSKTAAATCSNSLPGNTCKQNYSSLAAGAVAFLAQQPQRGTESTMIKAGSCATLVAAIGTASAAPFQVKGLEANLFRRR